MASVSTIMSKHIIGVAPSTKLSAALRLMEANHVSLLPVVDRGRLVGLLQSKDINEAHVELSNELRVKDAMSYDLVFAEEGQDINDAAKIMIKKKIARLPVVNNKKEMVCVGIVTSTDVVSSKR